jgi:hypothetical protein
MIKRRMAALVLALAPAVLMVGCVVVPAHPYYGYNGGYSDGYGYNGEVVNVAPPAPQVEYVGAPPVAGYIWLGGYWGWHGGRHEWMPGHWEAPRPGYHWVPHAWGREGGGWRLHPGHWSR